MTTVRTNYRHRALKSGRLRGQAQSEHFLTKMRGVMKVVGEARESKLSRENQWKVQGMTRKDSVLGSGG